jgi:hypothetical protein
MGKRVVIGFVLALALLLGASAYAIGLVGFDRQRGYFSPVWDAQGEAIYLLERQTRGFVWGLGWEFFSPPAHVRIVSDQIALLRHDPESGDTERLAVWEETPLIGKSLRFYRGRIFSYLLSAARPSEEGVEFAARLSIPRVPSSEIWSLSASWPFGPEGKPDWRQGNRGLRGTPEEVLMGGREVITLPGPEGYGAAVLLLEADGARRVLLRTEAFDAWYGEGIPDALVAERSDRERIERQRMLRAERAALIERFLAEGLSEGAAKLRATDEMQAQGLLPKGRRIVAEEIEAAPEDMPVFEIPPRYLEVGLFTDLAEAVAEPGKEVDSSTGSYLRYADDDLGPRLKAHREAGNRRFVISIEGKLYRIETLGP